MSIRRAPFAAPIASMDLSQVRASLPVAASPIKTASLSANWLFGCGTPLVVDGGYWWFGNDIQTRMLKYAYRVDGNHGTLGVYISASATTTISPNVYDTTLSVLINGTSYYTVGSDQSFTLLHFPMLNLTSGDVSSDLTFQWNGGVVGENNLYVHNILIYEAPINVIEVAGTGAVEPGNLIYDGYDDRESIAGLERAAEELRSTYFRRGTLFNWCAPNFDSVSTSTVINTTSTTYQQVFPDLKPAIQARLMYSGETVRTVRVAVFAWGLGSVKVSMTNGDSVTLTIDGSGGEAGAWYLGTMDVETDDPSRWETDGGIRGGTRDEIQIEYKAAASSELDLAAVSIYEIPGL